MGAEPQARTARTLELTLEVAADVVEQQLDAMPSSLRRQLLQLDVKDVDRVPAGPPPDDPKAAETVGGRPDRTAKLRFGDEVEFTICSRSGC